MNRIPLTRYRVTPTSDGAGGFVAAAGAPYPCFGTMTVCEKQSAVMIDRHEDIRVEDWIVSQDQRDLRDAYYRVLSIIQAPRAQQRILTVERMARPIWPVLQRYILWQGSKILFNGSYLVWP